MDTAGPLEDSFCHCGKPAVVNIDGVDHCIRCAAVHMNLTEKQVREIFLPPGETTLTVCGFKIRLSDFEKIRQLSTQPKKKKP